MGDGTFQPDGEVTYAQVIVMLVNAMKMLSDSEMQAIESMSEISPEDLEDVSEISLDM